jgi:hypothetical protein
VAVKHYFTFGSDYVIVRYGDLLAVAQNVSPDEAEALSK